MLKIKKLKEYKNQVAVIILTDKKEEKEITVRVKTTQDYNQWYTHTNHWNKEVKIFNDKNTKWIIEDTERLLRDGAITWKQENSYLPKF